VTVSVDERVLDNPVWTALNGPHAHLARRHGQAARYLADVSPFAGVATRPEDSVWSDVARITGPGQTVALPGWDVPPPPDWPVLMRLPGVQLAGTEVYGAEDAEAERLTRHAVPEMLDLVERTRPGPFLRRTIAMGSYLGIRRRGQLVAMAGERLHPPGFTEISAVCTDPAYRGQGLASRLVLAVAAGIRARGEVPFLHTAADNTGAIRLYLALGFHARRETLFQVLRAPVTAPGAEG
jgi:ribosomal protein S18 acetylase RimI-like enzyme